MFLLFGMALANGWIQKSERALHKAGVHLVGYRLFIFAGMTAIIALLAERVSALFLDEAIEQAQRDNALLRAVAKSVDRTGSVR